MSAPAASSSVVAAEDDHIVDGSGHWRRYDNARFDFAIEIPPGFVAQPRPQNGDGRIFIKEHSRLRVSGRYNLDATFDEQIAAAAEGLNILEQKRLSPVTWRATGQLDGGREVALLLARGNERIVAVRFEYPGDEPAVVRQAERALSGLLFDGHAGPLTYRYRPGRYASEPVSLSLPGARNWPVAGNKLIPWERANQLGETACRYGLSGRTEVCDADKEAGLAFSVIDRPLQQLRTKLPEALAEPTTLAGRRALRLVEQAEGSGTSYIFIPAGSRTVAVVRSWRKDSDSSGYQAILRDISFDKPAEPGLPGGSDRSMGWQFHAGPPAKLVYGETETDNISLLLRCGEDENVRISFLRPAVKHRERRFRVSSGDQRVSASARYSKTQLGGYAIRASLPASTGALLNFRNGGALQVDWDDQSIRVPTAGPLADRFFQHCRTD